MHQKLKLFAIFLLFCAINAQTLSHKNQIMQNKTNLDSKNDIKINTNNESDSNYNSESNFKNENISQPFALTFGLDFYGNNLEDNTNYFDSFTDLSINANAILKYDLDSKNAMFFGGYILQDFYKNTKNDGLKDYDLWAFYSFNKDIFDSNFRASFGLMPRKMALLKYYDNIMSLEYNFYHPSIKGMLISINSPYGISEGIIDWYGGNGDSGIKSIDKVRFGINNKYSFFGDLAIFGFEFLFNHQKNHFALANSAFLDNPTILDQMTYRMYIASDLKKYIGIDKAQITLSYLANADRLRFATHYDEFKNNGGFEGGVDLFYKFIGLNLRLYVGDAQMQYYDLYKKDLYNALEFYHTKVLNQNEIYLVFNIAKYVNFRFSSFFNLYKTDTFHYLNQILISINIDSRAIRF